MINKEIQIVLASKNMGKVRELQQMMPSWVKLISQTEAGVTSQAEENGDTYSANALLKAQHIFALTGLPTLADDSGLECEALGGAPGIHTARFAGENATDGTNIDRLLEVLRGKSNRRARFVSHLTLVTSRNVYDFEGYLYGEITTERRGNGGFGYDPVFRPEGYDQTVAELTDEEKNKISHRHKASEMMLRVLADVRF